MNQLRWLILLLYLTMGATACLAEDATAAKPAAPPAPRMSVKSNPRDGAEMVWIPAGEFIRGSDEGEIMRDPRIKFIWMASGCTKTT